MAFAQYMNCTVVRSFSMQWIEIAFCHVVTTLFQSNFSPLLEHDCCYTFTGEDVNGMSFEGADEELLRRALSILEDQGKCTIFKGETSSDDGIKFF